MTIANYTDLQASVKSWMNKSNASLDAVVPDFIRIAESKMMRKLRLKRMRTQTTTPTVIGTRTVALPADWLEFVRGGVKVASQDAPLSYMPEEQLQAIGASQGLPAAYYSLAGDGAGGALLVLDQTPSTVYNLTLRYFGKISPLATTATNWVLTNHPDAYLFGALAEGFLWMRNPDEAKIWKDRFDGVLDEVQGEDDRAASSGSALRTRR